MRRRSRATPSFASVSISAAVFVLIQSCTFDRPAAPESKNSVAGNEQSRPVFGAQRETTATAAVPPTRTAPERKEPIRAKLRRETSDRDGDNSTRSRQERSEEEPTRFLYYRPPGARVGDPGEAEQRNVGVQQPVPADSISKLVFQWADTLLSRNLGAHMALYAPMLAQFGNRASVSRDEVRRYKQQFLAGLADLRRFEIHNLRIRRPSDPAVAFAVFRIDWHAAGAGESSRSAHYRLTLRLIDGRWQIESEEQVQIGSDQLSELN